MNNDITIKEFIKLKNTEKHIFTAGPAALCEENILGLEPCFGRGDDSYTNIENRVLSNLKKLTGHKNIVRMQGSGSMALEVMISNFAYGNILIIDTGYYSERIKSMRKGKNLKLNVFPKPPPDLTKQSIKSPLIFRYT